MYFFGTCIGLSKNLKLFWRKLPRNVDEKVCDGGEKLIGLGSCLTRMSFCMFSVVVLSENIKLFLVFGENRRGILMKNVEVKS